MPAEPWVPAETHRNSAQNQRCHHRSPRAGPGGRSEQAAFRCIAWLPADRRRRIRSFRGHPAVDAGSQRSEPAAPRRRTPPDRRGGGTYREHRRRRERTSDKAGLGSTPVPAWHRESDVEPVSGHRGHRAGPGPRSHSWRIRGRSAASPDAAQSIQRAPQPCRPPDQSRKALSLQMFTDVFSRWRSPGPVQHCWPSPAKPEARLRPGGF